jgi:hypothetical protein
VLLAMTIADCKQKSLWFACSERGLIQQTEQAKAGTSSRLVPNFRYRADCDWEDACKQMEVKDRPDLPQMEKKLTLRRKTISTVFFEKAQPLVTKDGSEGFCAGCNKRSFSTTRINQFPLASAL